MTFKTQSQTDGCILLNWTLMKKSRFFCYREKGIIALEDIHHEGEKDNATSKNRNGKENIEMISPLMRQREQEKIGIM